LQSYHPQFDFDEMLFLENRIRIVFEEEIISAFEIMMTELLPTRQDIIDLCQNAVMNVLDPTADKEDRQFNVSFL